MGVHLDFSNQDLSSLKVKDEDAEDITMVNISDNNFKAIPQELQQFSNLQVLICSRNKVQISDSQGAILEEELDFLKPRDSNKFALDNPEDSIYSDEEGKDEDRSLSKSHETSSIDSGIQLIESVFDFTNLNKLSHLDLSSNKIEILPQSFYLLPNLEFLDLSNNFIEILQPEIKSSAKLTYLNLSWNCLTELPPWLFQLVRCAKLYISGNPVGENLVLPINFGFVCRRMKYLEMENIFMDKFPESLAFLLDLRHLIISNKSSSHIEQFRSRNKYQYFDIPEKSSNRLMRDKSMRNCLSTLPDCFINLVGVVKLEMRGCSLENLPDNFGSMKNLTILDISDNNLSWLPSSFPQLSNLQFLNVSKNKLFMLPVDFEKLVNLRYLLLSSNKIVELPSKMQTMRNMLTLDLYDNKISVFDQTSVSALLERFDIGGNLLGLETVTKYVNNYLELQHNLRGWTGEWSLSKQEDYIPNNSGFEDRINLSETFTLKLTDEGDDDDDDCDDDADFCENHVNCTWKCGCPQVCADIDRDGDETNAIEESQTIEDEEEQDWNEDCEPYGKLSKIEYK